MRTFSHFAASLACLFVLNAPAAVAAPAPATPLPVALMQSLSQVIDQKMDALEARFERWDDEARYQRILSRRGSAPTRVSQSLNESFAPRLVEDYSYGEQQAAANPVIVGTIKEFNEAISESRAEQLAALIEVTARRYAVDPLLVTALVSQESAFYQSATSPVGATGLGQLMPETAQDLGVDPHDPVENLDGSVRYLADLLYYWSGSEDPTALALASYNAGAGNVEHYGGIPPFEETQHYVVVIKDRYATLSSGRTVFGS